MLFRFLGDYVGPLKWISPQYKTGGYLTDYRRKHGNESELGVDCQCLELSFVQIR